MYPRCRERNFFKRFVVVVVVDVGVGVGVGVAAGGGCWLVG